MTATETIEYAQSSIDQLERGIGFVQDRLTAAEDIAVRVDELAITASDAAAKARRGSKYLLIFAGIAIVGVVVFAASKKCRMRTQNEPVEESAPEEATE